MPCRGDVRVGRESTGWLVRSGSMDCSQAKSLFNTFLDSELTGSLAAEFAAHKLQCAACRRELALLEVMGHVLATDTSTPGLDAEFTDRLVACALAPANQPRRWPRRLLYIGGPLAAAACLLLTFSLLRSKPQDAPLTPQVLPWEQKMDSPAEMLKQVEQARLSHPDDAQLAALESALREHVDRISAGTQESTKLLENFGKMTIMEILDSIQIDRSKERQEAPPSANTSGVDRHAPPVGDL